MKEYDYIVVGGGSGGVASARRAASYGARVALIEARRLGGTCVNLGCVPKKLMFNAASMAEYLDRSADLGFKVERPRFDWAAVKTRRDEYVAKLNTIYERGLATSGVEHISGRAKLSGEHRVDVNGQSLSAPHILLAVGGYPKVPDVPGAQLGITSNGFFELEEQPRRVAVIGTGYIGVELGGILNALGSQVCLFSKYDALLPHFDSLVHDELRAYMVETGIDYQPHSEPKRLARGDDGNLKVITKEDRTLSGFDAIIWAVGRSPASAGLGLDRVGIQTDSTGAITVDEWQNTTASGLYAVGDVTQHMPLTPVAIAAGRRLADRLFGNQPDAKLNFDNIPTVVFSHPPIAAVGLTEAQAREQYQDVKVYTTRFSNLFYALSRSRPKTAMKLITEGKQERVVGIHCFGMSSDELIQGFAVAMKMGATKRDLDDTVAIHPTAAEELVTLQA
jgi:glutathione reductase (NADPH)